jgi:hypothetical protein
MTPSDLYSMGMESQTAYEQMKALCSLLGTPFPPKATDHTQLTFNTQGKHNVNRNNGAGAIWHRQDNQPAQPQPC